MFYFHIRVLFSKDTFPAHFSHPHPARKQRHSLTKNMHHSAVQNISFSPPSELSDTIMLNHSLGDASIMRSFAFSDRIFRYLFLFPHAFPCLNTTIHHPPIHLPGHCIRFVSPHHRRMYYNDRVKHLERFSKVCGHLNLSKRCGRT